MNIDHNEELKRAQENLANGQYENLIGKRAFRLLSVEDVKTPQPVALACEQRAARVHHGLAINQETFFSVLGTSPTNAIAMTIWKALEREGYKIIRQ